jgi:hypothetical protein
VGDPAITGTATTSFLIVNPCAPAHNPPNKHPRVTSHLRRRLGLSRNRDSRTNNLGPTRLAKRPAAPKGASHESQEIITLTALITLALTASATIALAGHRARHARVDVTTGRDLSLELIGQVTNSPPGLTPATAFLVGGGLATGAVAGGNSRPTHYRQDVLTSCLIGTGGVPAASVPNELALFYQSKKSAAVTDGLLVVFARTQTQARRQVTTDLRTPGAHWGGAPVEARGGNANIAWAITGPDYPLSAKSRRLGADLARQIERLLRGCLTKARR